MNFYAIKRIIALNQRSIVTSSVIVHSIFPMNLKIVCQIFVKFFFFVGIIIFIIVWYMDFDKVL